MHGSILEKACLHMIKPMHALLFGQGRSFDQDIESADVQLVVVLM
jgi:hypothetical protein